MWQPMTTRFSSYECDSTSAGYGASPLAKVYEPAILDIARPLAGRGLAGRVFPALLCRTALIRGSRCAK